VVRGVIIMADEHKYPDDAIYPFLSGRRNIVNACVRSCYRAVAEGRADHFCRQLAAEIDSLRDPSVSPALRSLLQPGIGVSDEDFMQLMRSLQKVRNFPMPVNVTSVAPARSAAAAGAVAAPSASAVGAAATAATPLRARSAASLSDSDTMI
jgi:hypothetical protein